MKKLEIFLPGEEIARLEQFDAITLRPAPKEYGDSFGGLNRAISWMTNRDCAILSGWRCDNSRKVNDDNNRNICNTLRENGYGVCKCRGCYAEAGKEVSAENSFFVFDNNNRGKAFFDSVRELAEKYEQDCFLFKEAGENKPAFLFGTNAKFGMGKRQDLGPLHIGSYDAENFTKIGSGQISFN